MVKRPRLKLFASLLLILVILIGVFVQRQAITDWLKLYGYTPPAAVSKLASDDTMNAYTKHLFYLNKPQLVPTVNSFRVHCPEDTQTIVLGCYHPDQDGIYIYAVSDPSLAGIQQVTAAHEVLHAVYARLTKAQRSTLDAQLEAYYSNGLTDPTVLAEVKLYKQTEPDDVYDEMSCTFGTEIANLPPGLEAYYARYFTNRQAIIGYHQQYAAQFLSRQSQIATDDTQLKLSKQQIQSDQSDISAQSAQLASQRSQLNMQLQSGNNAGYNSGIAAYNANVEHYNQSLERLQSEIAAYNQLVNSRNALAGQLTTLDNAIDTRLPVKAAART